MPGANPDAHSVLPFPRPASFFLFSPPLFRQLRRSLERLGLDKVDLYQLHSPTGINSFESYAKGLAECYKLGLCRHIGVSNFSLEEMWVLSSALDTLSSGSY